MTQSGWSLGSSGGGRRKKVYEYLKAANELRQTYTAQLSNSIRELSSDEYYSDIPGAFPDFDPAKAGEGEMVLFPSYARRIVKKKPQQRESDWDSFQYRGGWTEGVDDGEEAPYYGRDGSGDTTGTATPRVDRWEDESEDAIVDVDVRGWIYLPHRGPMGRKHRLMVALARKLSGIPAPNGNNSEPADKIAGTGDEEVVNQQAQLIINEADKERNSAWKEGSSEDRDDRISAGRLPRRSTTSSSGSISQSSQMSKDELSAANANLMERIRPFLAQPMADAPISVFFFNDEQSQSRNVLTNESGHFSVRTGLSFVPTHIRVLASEYLSIAKDIQVIEPAGVSLVSDIDDTVKRSGIIMGAKEVCRNTFVRELSELTVDGVGQWYRKLAGMGVQLHYVSNSPWQLYSLLEKYFKVAGLPPGSFHLKQYSGMLQGIFESAAERKRGSLERIMRDFPERKFIFVGDSGEADLEVYTDIALTHPGRVLGIFIRDVTTPVQKNFFDKSVDHLGTHPQLQSRSTGQIADRLDAVKRRPALPPRRPREPQSIDNGDLIDLSDEAEEQTKPAAAAEAPKGENPRQPPAKPFKPSALRRATTVSDPVDSKPEAQNQNQNVIRRKPAPPLPPRRAVGGVPGSERGLESSTQNENYSSLTDNLALRPKPQPGRSIKPPPVPPPRRSNTGLSTPPTTTTNSTTKSNSIPASLSSQSQPQKQSYPAAAFQYASDRLNWSSLPSSSSNFPRPSISNPPPRRTSTSTSFNNGDNNDSPSPNKREEIWRRRWERAKDILDDQGVVLGSWRVGSDVQDVCVWLVKEALGDVNMNSRG